MPHSPHCARSRLAALRLADLLDEISSGLSIKQATLAVGVSKRTVWVRRRRDPAFAAALHQAQLLSREIQAEIRDRRYREKFFALALEADGKKWLSSGRMSRRMKHVWYRWKHKWPSEMPGCSPSHLLEWQPGQDRLSYLVRSSVRDKMLTTFTKRRELRQAQRVVREHLANQRPR